MKATALFLCLIWAFAATASCRPEGLLDIGQLLNGVGDILRANSIPFSSSNTPSDETQSNSDKSKQVSLSTADAVKNANINAQFAESAVARGQDIVESKSSSAPASSSTMAAKPALVSETDEIKTPATSDGSNQEATDSDKRHKSKASSRAESADTTDDLQDSDVGRQTEESDTAASPIDGTDDIAVATQTVVVEPDVETKKILISAPHSFEALSGS
ncbi:hypothetical protein LPJ75_005352, partial [Coemansia sp. RSA 2598]